MTLDHTHDPALRSWLRSANDGVTDFPVQNLPHGVFRRLGTREAWRGGVAIGDQVLDLAAVGERGLWSAAAQAAGQAAAAEHLNGLMAMGRPAWRALRADLSRLLREDGVPPAVEAALRDCLVPQSSAEMALPARVGNYTDFFTSVDHMLNMGRLFQPDRPMLPQFLHLPIAYHGRASTVEVSGTVFERPQGQHRLPGADAPVFAPTRRLDHEVEIGAWVGPGNARGEPIAIDEAEDHLFGICLLNDWSARDVQGWEAVPLGPFAAKNFLTSVSPWIVTMEALAPFRCPVGRPADSPTLPYLTPGPHATPGGFDLCIEAALGTPRLAPQRISLSSTRHCAWSFAQMLTHHTANGCALQPGDLLGSGTQSGPGPGEQGCLMELTVGGRDPLVLPNGEQRTQLEDGDTLVLRAWAERPGAVRIGLGECRGTVRPARVR